MQSLNEKKKLRRLEDLEGENKEIQEDTDASAAMSIKPERESTVDAGVKIGAVGEGER